jgi:hypothetical protein
MASVLSNDVVLEAPVLTGLLSDASQSQLRVFIVQLADGVGFDGFVLTKLQGTESRHTGDAFIEYAVHRISYEGTFLFGGDYYADYASAVKAFNVRVASFKW